MAIISTIGRKSFKVRIIYLIVFTILIIGAASMLYPFMVMLSGSVSGHVDFNDSTIIPTYWHDDLALFQKYSATKYNLYLSGLEISWERNIPAWKKIAEPEDVDPDILEKYMQWRGECPIWFLGMVDGLKSRPKNARLFEKFMITRFDGNLQKFNLEMDMPLKSWTELNPPREGPRAGGYRYPNPKDRFFTAYQEFAATCPVQDRIIHNVDGMFLAYYIIPKYGRNIEAYNKAHALPVKSLNDIFLPRRVPNAEYKAQRADWEEFVRDAALLVVLRLDKRVQPDFRRFIAGRYNNNINEYNSVRERKYKSFDQIQLPVTVPELRVDQVDWEAFIRDRNACPAECIEVYGPRQMFEEYVAQKRGVSVAEVTPLHMPIAQADWKDCKDNASNIRWEFTTRNYRQVMDFLFFHGRGIRNTIIYCSLAVILALLVNPIAAYALSRYKPPSTYKVLLLCMVTMAFPGEVTMIPAFLLMKKFPLWMLLGGSVGFGLSVWGLSRFCKKLSEPIRMIISIAVAVIIGWYLIPLVCGDSHISLLNTFAALVLPSMANGYSIFLLKGFFDSLPRELYEAADLDGASEWTKFWQFTMNLSKPILAVIALQAFTMAYTQFMMALIIIPDQNMWTLMVWLFQLQSTTQPATGYAALVIAAIPTFFIFLICQSVIIKGIVVPTEK